MEECYLVELKALVNSINGTKSHKAITFTAKNTVISLISWYGNFVERHSFRIVSGDSPETMRKLCLSTKFPYQEIRWNYGFFRSGLGITLSVTPLSKSLFILLKRNFSLITD